ALMRRQSPATRVRRSGLGDQRSGNVVAIASTFLDGMRRSEPLAPGIDQQAGEQARFGRFGLALMIAPIVRDLVPHRGPGLSIDQCRMLAWVELVFVGNLTGVNRVREHRVDVSAGERFAAALGTIRPSGALR